jgi:hypothetical protein
MSTDGLVYSADKTTNDVVFRRIVDLHFKEGWVGADPTYGKGTFWKLVDSGRFTLTATDLATGGPCLTNLPYDDSSLDFLVIDPPYMDGFFRPQESQTAHPNGDFSARYGNHVGGGYKGLYYQPAVRALYQDGVEEAGRVLRHRGVLVVKCQDAVSNHRQNLTHCHVWAAAQAFGFRDLDLFVVVRRDKPHGKRIKKQEHARKNHSYFMVFSRWRK